MSENCRDASRPRTLMTATLAATSIALMVAVYFVLAARAGRGAKLLILSLLVGLWAFSNIAVAVKVRRQLADLRLVCEACSGRLVYLPRRFTYSCSSRKGKGIICYDSVSRRIYTVEPEEVLAEDKIDPWAPLDFYCVKPLRGEQREDGRGFEGEFFYIDPYRPRLVRARGRYSWVYPEEYKP